MGKTEFSRTAYHETNSSHKYEDIINREVSVSWPTLVHLLDLLYASLLSRFHFVSSEYLILIYVFAVLIYCLRARIPSYFNIRSCFHMFSR